MAANIPDRNSTDRKTPARKLPAVVWAAGWVSFFTDLATEMVYPLLPAFYTATLQLNVLWQGLIEGCAETVVAVAKLFSGHWSDRTGGRKWWMVAGYGLSTVFRPLLNLAAGGPAALAIRGAERLGKGIRGAPRDAIISVQIRPEQRGRAFGVQRALDHAGALVGGLLAAGVLWAGWASIEQLFWWTLVPGSIAVLIIVVFVHERRDDGVETSTQGAHARPATAALSLGQSWQAQPTAMKRFLAVMAVFSLGNSTDMLLLKMAHDQFLEAGFAAKSANASLPLLWAWLHVVKTLAVPYGGRLSDRVGRAPTLRAGWIVYAVVYVGFAFAGGPIWPWILFGIYGLYYGLTEAPMRALVADLSADPKRRGLAYGLLHGVVGITALPASILCGGLWWWLGPIPAFITGGVLALLAAVLLTWALSGAQPNPIAGGNDD
jgi:MFS family permease